MQQRFKLHRFGEKFVPQEGARESANRRYGDLRRFMEINGTTMLTLFRYMGKAIFAGREFAFYAAKISATVDVLTRLRPSDLAL